MVNASGAKRRYGLEVAGFGLLLLALTVALISGDVLLVLAVGSAVIGLALVVSPRGLAVQQAAGRTYARRERAVAGSWSRTVPARRTARLVE